MNLIEYTDIEKLLELDIKDKEFDTLCLNAAYSEIEKQIGYIIEEKEHLEVLTVKDNRVILDAINISHVNEITDIETKHQLECFTVDYQNKAIYFVPCKMDNHLIFINYTTGFTKETLPSDLKEAIIKLFIHKQQTLRAMTNNTTPGNEEPQEIKNVIKRYARKSL